MSFQNIPFDRVIWPTTIFLASTFLISIIGIPLYIIFFDVDWLFQISLFVVFFILTGLSITLGYHRLFAHRAFKARFPIRFFTLCFGAAAFENSLLDWVSSHRRHHKHTDHDEDPYDASKGLFYSHIGWLLFKLRAEPPMDNVQDLEKDPWVVWQHKYWHILGLIFAFVVPTIIGFLYGGWSAALGAFLIGGVAKVVAVQQCTFCINSLCHHLGTQPYSKKCSARDSWIMALVTFGEGYHNYHHEFQHDYRNGVKPWHWDPTKWVIWTLSKIGLTNDLRRVSADKIAEAEAATRAEEQRLGTGTGDQQST